MFPGSTEGQYHPGQCYQQAERDYPFPFLSLEVLSLILHFPVHGKHEHTGQSSAKGTDMRKALEYVFYKERLRAGTVQPGGKKAQQCVEGS